MDRSADEVPRAGWSGGRGIAAASSSFDAVPDASAANGVRAAPGGTIGRDARGAAPLQAEKTSASASRTPRPGRSLPPCIKPSRRPLSVTGKGGGGATHVLIAPLAFPSL